MAAATSAASAQQPTVFPHSHVGFDSITSQIERKLLKRGFQFNVMCVGMCTPHFLFFSLPIATEQLIEWLFSGQTGLGKSTLVNTIFASHLIDSKGRLTPNEPVRSTTEIQTVSHSTYRRGGPMEGALVRNG